MKAFLENLIASTWNRAATPAVSRPAGDSLRLGQQMADGQITKTTVSLTEMKRRESIAILGKTGRGKSFLLRHLQAQDVRSDRGFVDFDLHGDTTPYLLGLIAQEEIRRHADLSSRLIVIKPDDPDYSVGLNVLAHRPGEQVFAQVAEFAEVLKQRWHLEHFGARTDELLRNALHVLSDNQLTLLEMTRLLTDEAFRAACLTRCTNPDIVEYFRPFQSAERSHAGGLPRRHP